MSIASDIIRGHTETIILRFLYEKDSYGYEINLNVQKLTNQVYYFKEATLYSAFKRLQDNGLITSYWGNEETGARRRYYSITEKGKEAYEANLKEWNEARSIIERLIHG